MEENLKTKKYTQILIKNGFGGNEELAGKTVASLLTLAEILYKQMLNNNKQKS